MDVFVGIDISKRSHVAVLLSAPLLASLKRLERLPHLSFDNSRAGFDEVLTWMRAYGEACHILVERTGHYGAALLQFLQEARCTLYVCQPQTRRQDKDDRRDARALAHLLYRQVGLGLPESDARLVIRPLVAPCEAARKSYALVHHRQELVEQTVRTRHRSEERRV